MSHRPFRAWLLLVEAAVILTVGLSTEAVVLATGPRPLEPGYIGQYLYRNDNFRTGQNLAETVLTPSSVNASKFGLQFTDKIDGYAYAEPLYVPAVAIPGNGTHNFVYVATENDSVYAFDADAPGPPLWHSSFINPGANPPITAVPATDLGCGDLVPIIGITATPVIDSTTATMYVVSKEKLGPEAIGSDFTRAGYYDSWPREVEESGNDYGRGARNRKRRQRHHRSL